MYASIRGIASARSHRASSPRVRSQDAPIAAIVKRVYTDVPEALHAAAGHSVAAHLRKLEREERVRRTDPAPALEATWSVR